MRCPHRGALGCPWCGTPKCTPPGFPRKLHSPQTPPGVQHPKRGHGSDSKGGEEEDGEEREPSKVHPMSVGGGSRGWAVSPTRPRREAAGYFKAMFSPPPRRPPRRCPRQAWSNANDGVMRLRQSPPAAPRQPRGRAKVSPARGYCRATCRHPPAVTRGQLALTPSPSSP